MLAEANVKMPFMYGDAVIDADTYDIILEGDDFIIHFSALRKTLSRFLTT
jgi:isopentenyl phosphate kinase